MNYDAEFAKFKRYELNQDTMCLHPFISFYPSPRGEVFPCCVAMKFKAHTTIDPDMDMDKMLNSEGFKKLRRDLISGVRAEECQDCWIREDSGIQSDRIKFLNWNQEKRLTDIKNVVDATEHDGSIPNFKIKYLEFRDSNICNYRCRFCNVNSSSKWISEWIDMGRSEFGPSEPDRKTGVSQSGIDWSKIDLSHLTNIHMAGGEPTVMDSTYDLLHNLIESGQSKKIDVGIVSNTSRLNYKKQDILKLFRNFRYVNWSVSLDGLGKTHDYLRAGGLDDWERVDKNIWALKKWQLDWKFSSSVKFHSTMNWNNAFQWWDLYKRYELDADTPLDVEVFFSTGPTGTGINELPNEQIERIIEFYESKNNYKPVQRILQFCKNNLAKTPEENARRYELVKEYKYEQIYLDMSRKQKFIDVFPEWEDFFKSIDCLVDLQERPIMRQVHNYIDTCWQDYFHSYDQTKMSREWMEKQYQWFYDQLAIHGPDDPEIIELSKVLKI